MKINQNLFAANYWVLLVVLAILFPFSTVRYERFAAKRHFGDFHVYYVTGERLLRGQSIYVDETDQMTPYKYSPLAASFFSMLAGLPENSAAKLWHILNLSFLLASAFLCFRLVLATRAGVPVSLNADMGTVFLSMMGISPAIVHCLNSGQVGLSILFFYLLGVYYAVDGKRDSWSAFFFALSAMFKYLPMIILPYLWFTHKKRLVLLFTFWFLAFHFTPALWLGCERNLIYLKGFIPFLTKTTLDHVSLLDFKNQSIWAYLYRLIFYDLGYFQIRNHPEWLMAIGMVLFLIFYSLIFFASKDHKKRSLVVDFSLLSILIVMFNPNAWKHNFVFLLFPYTVLLFEAAQSKWRTWKTLSAILIACLFFTSNRDLIGWSVRFELMSLSTLFLASVILFASLAGRRQLFR